jgi:hypothetical protein
MPAIVEIAFDDTETFVDCVLPNTEFWFSYVDPECLEQRVMRISCMANDGFTKVEVGDVDFSTDEYFADEPFKGLGDKTEEIWEIYDGTQLGLIAVTHTALLVSDFHVVIY